MMGSSAIAATISIRDLMSTSVEWYNRKSGGFFLVKEILVEMQDGGRKKQETNSKNQEEKSEVHKIH